MNKQQVHINFQCDKGSVAKCLRELAAEIEASKETKEFHETAEMCAEIDYEY